MIRYRAVPSRGVFCRLTCPEPVPDGEQCRGYHNLYEAIHDGFKPCPVCQPELCEDRIVLGLEVSPLVNHAVELINDGFLNGNTVADLAGRLHVSERHLRRIFLQDLGFSPTWLASCHRVIFAKRLLLETTMLITDVVYASGFGSQRQFNQVFQEVYNIEPRTLRRNGMPKGAADILYIDYEDGLDYGACLQELAARAIRGVMKISGSTIIRTFRINGFTGHATVFDEPEKKRLCVEITAKNRNCYLAVYHKIRRMFDIGLDEERVKRMLGPESFGGYLKEHPVPRLLLWFEPVECLHYCVLRQELSHEDAMEKLSRYADTAGDRYRNGVPGADRIYPEEVRMDPKACAQAGISSQVQKILDQLASLMEHNKAALAYNQTYSDFRKSLLHRTGMSEPAINYLAVFGLGMTNAYSYGTDWIESLNLEQWEEYRSYAALIYERMKQDKRVE